MWTVIISCEHGGNQIPDEYVALFKSGQTELISHAGWDIGALKLAKAYTQYHADFFHSEVSRLVVELNRSLRHPKLFSKFTQILSADEKNTLLQRYYHPYRTAIYQRIEELIKKENRVVHLSVHSFTPNFAGQARAADVGLLYDPRRKMEKYFCRFWQENIYTTSKVFRVRLNYPYLGKADGLVTALRKEFEEKDYIGIELEVNQKHLQRTALINQIQPLLVSSFEQTLLHLERDF